MICHFCLAPGLLAKLYTWVDKNGVTRRTYYPPPVDQAAKKRQAGQTITKQRKITSQKVELYVTSWCPYCKKAQNYFRSKGIAFKVYDIEKNKKAAARKKKLDSGRSGVPFAVVNGSYIHGYAPDQYAKALK